MPSKCTIYPFSMRRLAGATCVYLANSRDCLLPSPHVSAQPGSVFFLLHFFDCLQILLILDSFPKSSCSKSAQQRERERDKKKRFSVLLLNRNQKQREKREARNRGGGETNRRPSVSASLGKR